MDEVEDENDAEEEYDKDGDGDNDDDNDDDFGLQSGICVCCPEELANLVGIVDGNIFIFDKGEAEHVGMFEATIVDDILTGDDVVVRV